MHEFAAVLLFGLAVHAVVALVRRLNLIHAREGAAVWVLLALGLGVVVTWVTDYSLFAAWGIRLRALWMGPAATGLVIGATALVWQDVVSLLGSYARRTSDQAAEVEARIARPATKSA